MTFQQEEESLLDTGLNGKKTVVVLVIVAACFAVLWPKIFVPMIFGEAPSPAKTDDDGERKMIYSVLIDHLCKMT
jgi:hypothetical protein